MESRLDFLEAAQERAFPFTSESDLDELIHSMKDKKVVMLGESTHGTAEYYNWRRLITQRLIEEHDFQFVAVECDWPDAHLINDLIRHQPDRSAVEGLRQIHRWPTWMWANQEVAELIDWMRNSRGEFYGLDVYSLFTSIERVISYMESINPDLAEVVRTRYACFDPYKGDEIAYAKSLFKYPEGCREESLANLKELLQMQMSEIDENLFDAQQNARVIRNAERYYRSMLQADENSWNIRDHHMMDTLDILLHRYPKAKGIVWAHNTHIGDYRATSMKQAGYVNLGGLARERYGPDQVSLVGFGCYEGEVVASHAWAGKEEVMPIPPAREDSVEEMMASISDRLESSQLFFIFDRDAQLSPLSNTYGHRAIGVVYDPAHERASNYVPTSLAHRYDAFMFFRHTEPLHPLGAPFEKGNVPETYPLGQ